jgi:hypothetical protein
MDLPAWVIQAIRDYQAPETGEVTITIETYKTGVTRARIGGKITIKPPQK